jgi:hypothetical protein
LVAKAHRKALVAVKREDVLHFNVFLYDAVPKAIFLMNIRLQIVVKVGARVEEEARDSEEKPMAVVFSVLMYFQLFQYRTIHNLESDSTLWYCIIEGARNARGARGWIPIV